MRRRPRQSAVILAACALLACVGLAVSTGAEGEERVFERRVMQQSMMLHDLHHSGMSRHPAPGEGKILWRTQLSGHPIAPPSVDDKGRSYWSTRSGILHVLNIDGASVWETDLGAASHSSPALDSEGRVFVANRNGRISALDTHGELIWSVETKQEIISSPLIDERGEQIVLSMRDKTISLDRLSGRVRFLHDAKNNRYNSSPALGPDGLVRVVNWKGFATALTGRGRVAWRVDLGSEGFWASPTLGSFGTMYTAGEVALVAISPGGTFLWDHQLDGRVSGFLAMLPDGRVLVPTGGAVTAVKPNGDRSWSFRLPEDQLQGSLGVSKHGDVLFGTAGGAVISLSDKGRQNWRLDLGPASFQAAAPVIPAPVDGRPRAYIGGTNGAVFCIE